MSEGRAAQILSQHASQAVPRSATRMTTTPSLPGHPLPPSSGCHPAPSASTCEDVQQTCRCQSHSMAEPQLEAHAFHHAQDEPEAVQPPLGPQRQCLQHPKDSLVDQFPQHWPNHTHTQQVSFVLPPDTEWCLSLILHTYQLHISIHRPSTHLLLSDAA